MTEIWLTGPVPGYDPLLMPVVHSLLQVKAEVDALLPTVDDAQLWERPGGAASIGFHIRHIGGSTERLLTYVRGDALTGEQLAASGREASEVVPRDVLVAEMHARLDRMLDFLRTVPPETLLDPKKVGRAGLPSTTIGLLFHIAEHATRHAGQALTTARVVGAARTST
jgi:uncharacterized damage-inducible protein DinB